MSWFTTKRDKADVLMSKYIRLRDGGRCVYTDCNFKGTGLDGIHGLDCSHFWSRRAESTRYDTSNLDSFCRKHHKYLGEHREEYKKFKREQLGEDEYNALDVRAHTTQKKDRILAAIIAGELLKTLKPSLKI